MFNIFCQNLSRTWPFVRTRYDGRVVKCTEDKRNRKLGSRGSRCLKSVITLDTRGAGTFASVQVNLGMTSAKLSYLESTFTMNLTISYHHVTQNHYFTLVQNAGRLLTRELPKETTSSSKSFLLDASILAF